MQLLRPLSQDNTSFAAIMQASPAYYVQVVLYLRLDTIVRSCLGIQRDANSRKGVLRALGHRHQLQGFSTVSQRFGSYDIAKLLTSSNCEASDLNSFSKFFQPKTRWVLPNNLAKTQGLSFVQISCVAIGEESNDPIVVNRHSFVLRRLRHLSRGRSVRHLWWSNAEQRFY